MKTLFTTLLFCCVFAGQAQMEKDTLYGFRQRVTPGAKAAGDIDENGNFIKTKSPELFNYAIYLVTASNATIYPIQMWMNGEVFSVKADRVLKMPEALMNAEAAVSETKPLLPEKPRMVLKLTPLPLTADKNTGRAKALATANAVVVLYKSGGKLRYGVLKKFTDRAHASLQ